MKLAEEEKKNLNEKKKSEKRKRKWSRKDDHFTDDVIQNRTVNLVNDVVVRSMPLMVCTKCALPFKIFKNWMIQEFFHDKTKNLAITKKVIF